MPSGAGHDTGHLSHHGAIMIFVPSINGRSHCPEEETRPEHLDAGLAALRECILALDIAEAAASTDREQTSEH